MTTGRLASRIPDGRQRSFDLVPRRHDNPQLAVARYDSGSIVADGGEDGEVHRRQTGSPVDDDGAGSVVGTSPPDVGAGGELAAQGDEGIVLVHDLQGSDRVDTMRDPRARHDPNGLTASHRTDELVAGERAPDHPPPLRRSGFPVECVAVHRRPVEAGDGSVRDRIGGRARPHDADSGTWMGAGARAGRGSSGSPLGRRARRLRPTG